MARPGLLQHRKFRRLSRSLGSDAIAMGSLELMWSAAYESGDDYLGEVEDVEAACRWQGEPGVLCAALLAAGGQGEAGFIEETDPGRFKVHDLFDHAPDYVPRRAGYEAERRKPKTCAHCGIEFRSREARARFCSSACRSANARDTQSNARVRSANVRDTDRHARVTHGHAPPAPAPAPAPPKEKEKNARASGAEVAAAWCATFGGVQPPPGCSQLAEATEPGEDPKTLCEGYKRLRAGSDPGFAPGLSPFKLLERIGDVRAIVRGEVNPEANKAARAEKRGQEKRQAPDEPRRAAVPGADETERMLAERRRRREEAAR